MMKIAIFTFLALIVLAECAPQYGGGGGGNNQRQRRKCRVIKDVEYVEEYDTQCSTSYENKCSTLYREKCTPYQDEVCQTYQRRQCDQKQKRECSQKYRTEYENYSEPKCTDEYVRVCEKAWIEDGYGGKDWKEDPSTCKEVPKTKCVDVQLQREKRVPYEDCYNVPYEDCYNVPDKKCNYVTKQNCKQEPYQDCKRIPKKNCKQVHKQVPKETRRRVCEGDKDWQSVINNNQGGGKGDYDYDDYDYDDVHGNVGSNVRNVNDPYSASDVSEGFVRNQNRPNRPNNNNNNNRPLRPNVDLRDSQVDDDNGEGDESRIHFG